MFCYKCGYQIPDDSVFCTKCGEKVNFQTVSSATAIPASGNIVNTPAEKVKPVKKKSKKGFFIIGAVILIRI